MKVVGITLETNHLNIHSNEMLLFTIVCVNVITEKKKQNENRSHCYCYVLR